MKKLLFYFAAVAVMVACGRDPVPEPEIDVLTKITDPVFRAYCEYAMDNPQELLYFNGSEYFSHSPWDTDGNGKLSPAEAAAVEAIYLHPYMGEEKILSLAGIEYFTGLLFLDCSVNSITELDVSECTELSLLSCYANRLTSLDVSECTELTRLECDYNPGDWVSTFPVKAWFDNDSIPSDLEIPVMTWDFDDKMITLDFQKDNSF